MVVVYADEEKLAVSADVVGVEEGLWAALESEVVGGYSIVEVVGAGIVQMR